MFNKKLLIIAIILSIFTTLGIYAYIRAIQNDMEYVDIVVAKKDIPAGTKLDKTMIGAEKIAGKHVLENRVNSEEQAIGKYTSEKIIKGEQIISGRLTGMDRTTFAYKIPEDKRAVTIAVDEVAGVAFLIKQGDYVDVLAYLPEKKNQGAETGTLYENAGKVFLENVLVLAVNQNENSANSKASNQEDRKKITLAVSPSEAEKVILCDHIGKIRLALRSPDDNAEFRTTGATRRDVAPSK